MESNYFETPISNFRRLIEQDNSDKFQIFYNFSSSDQKDNNNNDNFIEVSRNEARVISKKINELMNIDPTIDKYAISIPFNSDHQKKEIFEEIFRLLIRSTRERVNIPSDKENEFYNILFLLGEETKNNFYDISNIKEGISLLNTELNSIAVRYLSEHFLELLESGSTKHLNDDIMYSIIDSYNDISREGERERREGKKMKEERERIYRIMKTQEESKFVIHFILLNFQECEGAILNDMIEYIADNIEDEIVKEEIYHITGLIRYIFLNPNKFIKNNLNKEGRETREIKFEGDELSGIIRELTKFDSNKSERNCSLKLSGGGYPSYPITNLIQYDQNNIDNYYHNWSLNKPSSESDSWIEIDFMNRKINLTSYTIRTAGNGTNSCYNPKSWRIVGSNDHDKWTILDHVENNAYLNGNYKQHHFECSQNYNYYRYIRYIQEDSWNSSSCKYSFCLTCIEMFGSILNQSS
ncbi:hypothetical protein M9Y10_015568 [Tritrichomonas musculus]|uniref:F5/8 type C domain-containing protein n=1 Tax=Tritrichomonas musculus TaxID=1915356 RepID=A0ABR2L2M9_9EUKA